MGTGDYICLTLRGSAPWGFTLREAEGDTYRPLLISQVEEGGCAFLAGVQDGDEVVSLNGEPCVDLTLLQALELVDASIGCVQLLLKRYGNVASEDDESEELHCDKSSSEAALESTTLHILSSDHKELESNKLIPKEPQLISTELHVSSSTDDGGLAKDEDVLRCLSPGDMVELQVSLSEQTLDDAAHAQPGSSLVIQGDLSDPGLVAHVTELPPSAPTSVPVCAREPLGQRGVVLSSPSMLGQVEFIVQQPAASGAGRSILSVGGPEVSRSTGSQSEGEEGGGKRASGCLTVSFGLPSEEATTAEEWDSDSDGKQDKPYKHRAKHARLRRSESQSDKQLKEAKSKCKRIALLLTAAPPHPNNKGVLMFKKHRQRAKKYTLVSYGTGEDDPDSSDVEDEENEDDREESHTVEIKLVVPDPKIDKHSLAEPHNSKGVCTFDWDKGLLEIKRNLKNQAGMECLPETKGKGALMFAQRRQRIEEISAEHEELRRQGLPVESIKEVEKKTMEHSYIQSTTEAQAYMDVNIHQQSQQRHQYQKYQEQQYYEQQQHYHHQQQQQQLQQQQFGQHNFQQQQMYPQQQVYCQEQQQIQHHSTSINGTVHHQSSEMQTSFSNRTAKPFSVESMVATPYHPAMSGVNQDPVGHGEQIASRDERIATPAIKTGLLLESRKKNAGKPMFTFKEAPKVSPNPALLNLLNRNDKKLGFESGPEEDYLSLGAEACNFLQSSIKQKTPPPVAPKPLINPNAFPWNSQLEVTNQDMPQQAENSLCPPAVVPATESTAAPEANPDPAPVCEPSPLEAAQEVPASTTTIDQQTWILPETESQPPAQPPVATAREEYDNINPTVQPAPVPVSSWAVAQTHPQQQPPTNSWPQAQVQPQAPTPSQSPPQPPWVTRKPSQTVTQHPPVTNTWTSQSQPPWNQPQEQTQAQPTWAHSQESTSVQQMQQPWGQRQDQPMQHEVPWAQPSQSQSPHQPPWMQQPQPKPQVQPPWVQQAQMEPQQQPAWIQQQQQHLSTQQVWLQAQAPTQSQPPWVSTQPQQPSWPQAQAHIQPPWMQSTQAPGQTEANPWAPMPPQAQPQQTWGQQPPEHSHPPASSWATEQNQTQSHHQAPWVQAPPPQPKSQSNWQSSPQTSVQSPVNSWSPAQPQVSGNTWASQSQSVPGNVSTPIVNAQPSPKPWQPQQNVSQNRVPPSPPQRMHSFTVGQRTSSPINPMATVLNPSSQGSAFEMPAVRGKGADMFAKRRSRMDKYVVDSETVEANKASRSTSPAASLPNEWKYTPNALGRSYSLSPPSRMPSLGQKSVSASSSPKLPARSPAMSSARQASWPERVHKPISPWEAASRHPLGLVDEAFAFQNLQHNIASNVRLAAQRKALPEPPAEWKVGAFRQSPQKTYSYPWSQSRGQIRAPLPSFVSPTRSNVSSPPSSASPVGYRSLPRQWRPQRSWTGGNQGSSLSYAECKPPSGQQVYKSVHTNNTWSWRQ